ncbi:MAG: C-GCAxxG-C-C family protein [Nitrospiraceae bacterium]|nr:C-GCAxxG-C-C family protein [Nitrospiraceae bacterium]MDA8088796.1 C-GCAxxG-C-C family protein [Nitrospiraceae bacterium]
MRENGILMEGISRRGLLKNAGKLAVGASAAAAAASGGLAFLSKADAKNGPTEKWPWPYVKLDPEKTAELAYNEWYRVFCGAAVISSVFSQLREKVGEPYKSFPVDAFVFLEGGMVGWGTICGSNAGANIVSNLTIGPRIAGPECADGAAIGADTLQWYSETALPTYIPKNPRVKTKIVQTVSDSPLCHVSVGRWMKASGYAIESPERKDRCARVAASVAYNLVKELNAWKDGTYRPKATWRAVPSVGITAQQNCTSCHGSNVPVPPMPVKG